MRRQATWLLGSRIFGAAAQAITLIFFGRAVDASTFGVVNIFLGIIILVGVVVDCGLTTQIVRSISVDKDSNRAAAAYQLQRRLTYGFGAVAVSAATAVSLYSSGAFLIPLAGIAIWVATDKIAEAAGSVFIARRDVVGPAISILIRRGVTLGLFVLLSQFISATDALGLALVLGNVIGLLFALPRAARQLGSKGRTTRREPPLALLSRSFTLGATNIFAQVKNIDAALVSSTTGSLSAGLYSAVTRLTLPVFLVTSALATVLMPAIADGGKRFARRTLVWLFIGVVASACALLALGGLAQPVIVLIYGIEYSDAAPLVLPIALGTILNAIHSPLNAILQSLHADKTAAWIGAGSAVALVMFIPAGGIIAGVVGSAWGYAFACLIIAICLGLVSWRKTEGD